MFVNISSISDYTFTRAFPRTHKSHFSGEIMAHKTYDIDKHILFYGLFHNYSIITKKLIWILSQKIINPVEIHHVCFCSDVYKQSESHLKKVETVEMHCVVLISFCWFFSYVIFFVYNSLQHERNSISMCFEWIFSENRWFSMVQNRFSQLQKNLNFEAVWVVGKKLQNNKGFI